MKSSAARDHWRHVSGNNHPFRISQISLSGIRGIGSPQTNLPRGSFLAICGHNGSGKTTLLRYIQACLHKETGDKLSAELQQVGVGSVVLEVEDKGTTHRVEFSIPGLIRSGPTFENVFYLEPSADAPAIVRKLRNTVDLAEIVETAEPREFATDLYSYAVGKKYDRVTAYELEIGDSTIPYFVVEAYGSTYCSEAMGLGEFSMFYLMWWLDFVPRHSLVLIEEPEAFISPRSQAAVANVLAKFTDEKRLFTVMTTHSPLVLGQIPLPCLRVLVRDGGTCNLLTATDEAEHLAVLGIHKPPMRTAFVEDIAAHYALEAALREFTPGALKNLSIVRGGSWNRVLTTLNGIPTDGHPMDFLCVLDADRKGKGDTCAWPLLFMPGDGPPDYQMVDAVQVNLSRFSTHLNISESTVGVHNSNLEGTDSHDWPHEFAKATSIEVVTVFRAMAACWVVDPRWSDEAKKLTQAIVESTR